MKLKDQPLDYSQKSQCKEIDQANQICGGGWCRNDAEDFSCIRDVAISNLARATDYTD
jgi:hypothetical protein